MTMPPLFSHAFLSLTCRLLPLTQEETKLDGSPCQAKGMHQAFLFLFFIVKLYSSLRVHVAEILEDIDAEVTGGVEIFPMGEKVYQSALSKPIQITGTGIEIICLLCFSFYHLPLCILGFVDEMSFVFDPELRLGVDYDMEVQSKNRGTRASYTFIWLFLIFYHLISLVMLRLRAGKKWRADAGIILAKSVKIDKKEYPLAGSEGIRVAVVLGDPVITPSKDTFHESQSKLIVISGEE
jgi:hypothetical protein